MSWEVPGFRASGVAAGIKSSGALDLALVVSDRPAAVAGVFTRNRFPGAPVVLGRARVRRGRARAVVVNSGISNVATGSRGLEDARRMAACVARALGVPEAEVLPSSTGVIGRRLPLRRIEAAVPLAVASLSPRGFPRAARAILTTDTRPKLARRASRAFALLGIAKGSGMIMPDLATMLCFLATDVAAEPALLREALREAVEPTFNRLTVDGETSTSDTVLLLANGARGNRPLSRRSAGARELRRVLLDLCAELAEQLNADGEGVTRTATVEVSGARHDADALRAARRVATSVLVKTALFGADPNWGRIVQALGTAGVPLRPERVGISIGGVPVLRRGRPAEGPGLLARARRAMRRKHVPIGITLGEGRGRARVVTCDLGYGYVRINAAYTT